MKRARSVFRAEFLSIHDRDSVTFVSDEAPIEGRVVKVRVGGGHDVIVQVEGVRMGVIVTGKIVRKGRVS